LFGEYGLSSTRDLDTLQTAVRILKDCGEFQQPEEVIEQLQKRLAELEAENAHLRTLLDTPASGVRVCGDEDEDVECEDDSLNQYGEFASLHEVA
jgi:hypothetical protein